MAGEISEGIHDGKTDGEAWLAANIRAGDRRAVVRVLGAGADGAGSECGFGGAGRADIYGPWAEFRGGAGQALFDFGFAGRLSLRLHPEIFSAQYCGAGPAGGVGAGGHDSGVSLGNISESLHASDGLVSGASRNRGERVLRSGAQTNLQLSRSGGGGGWHLVRGNSAVGAGRTAGHALGLFFLAGVGGGHSGRAADVLHEVRPEISQRPARRSGVGLAEIAGGATSAFYYSVYERCGWRGTFA